MKTLTVLSAILSLSLVFSTGCSESEFSSGARSAKKKQNTGEGANAEGEKGLGDLGGSDSVGLDGVQTHVPSDASDHTVALGEDEIEKATSSGLDMTFDPSKSTLGGGSTVFVPVDFYFAIDVTGSMTANINTIKDNVAQFASELEKRKYKARLSLVPFRDRVESVLNPTDDINAFRNSVSGLTASGGGDANEAGLAAVQKAVEMIMATKPTEGFAAIILITDNPAHNGGDTKNCDINPIVDTFNRLNEAQQQRVKLYASVAGSGANCSGFPSAKKQIEDVLRKALAASPLMQRGSANLSYPFQKGTILDELVPLIEKTIPSKKLICLTETAKLEYEGTLINEYKATSLKDSYDRFVAGSKNAWADAIKGEDFDKYLDKEVDLTVNRCCIEQDLAAAGDFGSCMEDTQEVKVKIERK